MSKNEKIILPQNLQEQMMKFFIKTSIKRNKMLSESPLSKNTDKGDKK